MRAKGVEPLHLAALDPKSSASANSATPAYQLTTLTSYHIMTYLSSNEPPGNRTPDNLIKSQVLYRLS